MNADVRYKNTSIGYLFPKEPDFKKGEENLTESQTAQTLSKQLLSENVVNVCPYFPIHTLSLTTLGLQ